MDPYIDWIKKRTSWRTYNQEKLIERDRAIIEEVIKDPCNPPFGNVPRFKLIDYETEDGKIGLYGFIRGAQHYIAGAVEKASMSIEDYGYALERIILYATGLELGTCWLGGTFTRNIVSEKLGLEDYEVLPVITPIGYKR